VLIGETLMRAPDPQLAVRELAGPDAGGDEPL
jgi:indole-3-glycerol phosphate synthase